MSVLFSVLALITRLYIFVLIARLVVDWIQVFARDWRPSGIILVIVNGIYALTDPPLNALRRIIPPLRLGGIALDIGFILLFFGLSMLSSFFARLSYTVGV